MFRNLFRQRDGLLAGDEAIDFIQGRKPLLHEAEIVFRGEHLTRGSFDALLCESATLDCIAHAPQRSIRVGRFQKQIGACCERAHRRFLLRKVKRQTAHAHGVSHNQSIEMQIVSEDSVHDRRKGRRHRSLRVDDFAIIIRVDWFQFYVAR